MNITVVTEFDGAASKTHAWARDEENIDFFRQPYEACRCTVSFAAVELASHLGEILIDTEIRISDKPSCDGLNIFLIAESMEIKGENYSLVPDGSGLRIVGEGRVGVLYGVYELLKMQGYRWIEPGSAGCLTPPRRGALSLPEREAKFVTTSPVGRGFSLDGRLNENEELLLWMARNRLNVYFNYPNTARLMHKLGFIIRDGGHIFEAIMNPTMVTESGRTLFEEHEDWYGLPESGRRECATALRTQFCVSNDQLMDYLSEELLCKINRQWREAEEINVWGFDTWGGICTCERCKRLGNASDQMLYMASRFRDFLNKKRVTGELSRDIRMVLCAYEGSGSVPAPQNPVPENLTEAGDHVLFAPIVRCYKHGFGDSGCSYNAEYDTSLKDWCSVKGKLGMSILEYYNVSKFEDLPLLFLGTMKKDFLHYYERGLRGFSYMHIPMVNWGVRALTQVLYAELSWNVFADTDRIVSEYFEARYGSYAERMSRVYADISKASETVSSWRAWKRRSLLSKLNVWDGGIPSAPLEFDDHLIGYSEFEKIGGEAVHLWYKALAEVNEMIKEEKNKLAPTESGGEAVNPQELLRMANSPAVLTHLLDDKRGLIYGSESFALEYELVRYHGALYKNDLAAADEIFCRVEMLEERLESYYLPATYTVSLIAMISKDALTRTQLGGVVARCRGARNNGLRAICK